MAFSHSARPFRYPIVFLIVGIAGALWATDALAQDSVRLEPLPVIEKRLRSFAIDNRARVAVIHKLLAQSGCGKGSLSEEFAKLSLPPNVICVLPGETSEVIVVGAHTDKVTRAGDGVVDNWSGASLLPSLLFSMNSQKRRHTFVFVGFTGEERGLIGSEYYVEHLKPEQRARIEAMVNLDSLGLTPTKVWTSHADKVLLDALNSVAATSKLPVSDGNVDNIGTSDSESFASYRIPRITLHSVTPETLHVLHSDDDKLAAVRIDDYYDSYRLIAEYLVYLDRVLAPARTSSPANGAH